MTPPSAVDSLSVINIFSPGLAEGREKERAAAAWAPGTTSGNFDGIKRRMLDFRVLSE